MQFIESGNFKILGAYARLEKTSRKSRDNNVLNLLVSKTSWNLSQVKIMSHFTLRTFIFDHGTWENLISNCSIKSFEEWRAQSVPNIPIGLLYLLMGTIFEVYILDLVDHIRPILDTLYTLYFRHEKAWIHSPFLLQIHASAMHHRYHGASMQCNNTRDSNFVWSAFLHMPGTVFHDWLYFCG